MLDLLPPAAGLLPRNIGPYMAMMFAGFAIGILGHMTRARWLVTIGVILIFLGAFLLPLALNLTSDPPPRIESSE